MITVLATNLYKGASKAKKASHPVKSLPVTSHLKLYTSEGRLIVAPFDFDIKYRKENAQPVSARVEVDFETCVPARAFVDWLRVTQDPKGCDQIHLELVQNTQILKVKAGNTRAEFKCIDAQEFPPM